MNGKDEKSDVTRAPRMLVKRAKPMVKPPTQDGDLNGYKSRTRKQSGTQRRRHMMNYFGSPVLFDAHAVKDYIKDHPGCRRADIVRDVESVYHLFDGQEVRYSLTPGRVTFLLRLMRETGWIRSEGAGSRMRYYAVDQA